MIFHKYQKCTRAKKSKITMVHKYQQCTRTYFLGQMIGHSLKNIFDSLGFAYDFAFCQNKWSSKIFQNVSWSMSFKNDNIYQSFWGGGGPNKISKQNRCLVGQNLRFFEVPESKNNMFPRCPHKLSNIF